MLKISRLLLAVIPLSLVTFCQSASTTQEQTAPAAAPREIQIPSVPMTPDTITIRGKFADDCPVKGNLKIALHNVDNTWWKDLPVTNGEFVFTHYLTEPRRAAIRTIYGVKFDFFVTTKEKVYEIEISCPEKTEQFSVKGSEENAAYLVYSNANKDLQTVLDSFAKQDITKEEVFNLVKKTIEDYQKTLADVAAAHPNTFTAQVFCEAEKLPEGSLNSLESLQKNFLNRPAYANPQIYNDFLPQRILLNYLALRTKNSDPNQPIETLMSIGLKNKKAAMNLQENMSNIFYRMHEEDLVKAFINWADRNPDKMYEQSVKARLQNLKKVVAGSPMIDFELKDPSGKLRKFSETVKSGKLTALIFYSPTCGHCKEKVPLFKPVWDEYNAKGLKIFAVGSSAKDEEWKSFIKTHAKAEWIHVFQYEEGSQPSDLYYASNPTFILIDSGGTIISRIGDEEDVIEMIHEKLK